MEQIFGSTDGDRLFTGVIQITGSCDCLQTGFRVPHGIPILVCQPALVPGRVTLYDYQIDENEGILMLTPTASSWHGVAPVPDCGLLPTVLELCAGFGGMGLGVEFLGGHVVMSVDHCGLSIEHLKRNFKGKVLQVDLTSKTCAKQLHQQCPHIGTTTLGFPCQPFSSQGNQMGTQDCRFEVFWAGLRIIFLLQSQTAILECVPQVASVQEITKGLQALAHAMDWEVMTTILHLQDRWPSRRSRWWALLQPMAWHHLPLVSWPSTSTFANVGHIVDTWGAWSLDAEQVLALTLEEQRCYFDPRFGNDKRLLDMTDIAPALLHSYGNALHKCPCLCRSASFRLETLLRGGLRGFFVESHLLPGVRHLHPREAAYLLGVPDSIQYGDDLRAALALLGLIASPIQMVWVYGHLLFNANGFLHQDSMSHPEHWVRHYCAELLRQAAPVFRPTRPLTTQELHIIDSDLGSWTLTCPIGCTVQQLLQACRITLQWNEVGHLLQHGHQLQLEQLLDARAGPICLHRERGPLDQARPPLTVLISIQHVQTYQVHIMQGGQFLFEALRAQGLDFVHFLIDDHGRHYSADARVWVPMKLRTLTRLPGLPPALDFTANGAGDPLLGLSSLQLWTLLLDLHAPTPTSRGALLLPLPLGFSSHVDFGLLGIWTSADHGGKLLCLFAASSHWALLWGLFTPSGLNWTYFDGIPDALTSIAYELACQLCRFFGISSWTFGTSLMIPQNHPHTCGTIAFLTARALLGLSWTSEDALVLSLHQNLLCSGPSLGVIGYGPTSVATQLAALLATKGVPCQLAPERAEAAIKKFGVAATQAALQATNPWKDLKQLASKPGHNFQFVLKGELQNYIEQKAADKHGVDLTTKKKSRKSTGQAPQKPWIPDPQHLGLQRGLFVDAEDDLLEQLPLDQVVAEARGIALCTKQEAMPFIQDAKSISQDALALLIIEDIPMDQRARASISSLRFPVTYVPTADPLLIHGCLLQLGDVLVSRQHRDDTNTDMEITDTSVLKVQIYRDEITLTWDAFISSPIKHLIALVPKLRRCTWLQCDFKCGLYHAAVEENFDQVITEIWGRRFQFLDGKVTQADKAELFQVFLRVATPAITELLQVVMEGIYFEPRSTVTKTTDPDYSVVWIPGATKDMAIHKLRTMSHGLSLVRMRQRYGIRVLATHEATAHAELRPGDTFIKVNVHKIFRLHPLPHGLQRVQVAKLLQDWNWCAKPLQPARGTSEGAAWDVGAATDPTTNVMTAFSKDVLITLIKDRQEPDKVLPVMGPRRAQAHSRAQGNVQKPASGPATSHDDPWLQPAQDPWRNFMFGGSSPADPPKQQKRIDELETRLKADLSATLQEQIAANTGTSSSSASDGRLTQLEVSMAELQAHQQHYRTWFSETGARLAAQDDKLLKLQGQLEQQQTDLVAVRSEVHTSAETLHQAMQMSFQSMRQDLATDLSNVISDKVDRLETMITSKKTRHE